MLTRLSTSLGSLFAKLRHHFAEAFLPALCVASIVTVIDKETELFEPLKALVFAEVADSDEYLAQLEAAPATGYGATVISIDSDRYAQAYGGQAPLNRCQLLQDLQTIYAVEPPLLVIDVDLSPARWLLNAKQPDSKERCDGMPSFVQLSAGCQAQCEARLYDLLKAPRNTSTLLMLPFDVDDFKERLKSEQHGQWIKAMEDVGVHFGDPSVMTTMGIVLHTFRDSASFARLACETMHARIACWRCVEDAALGKDAWIDPRKYFSNIRLLTVSQFALTASMTPNLLAYEPFFFGRAPSREDLYLTPVGHLNGVEIHVASFLTLTDPLLEKHLWAFLADIGIAIVFGMAIDFCWRAYFHARFSSDAGERINAPKFVLLLACAWCGLLLGALYISWQLLLRKGIWASPIELAVGMLIEGWIRGAITGAVHASFALTHEAPPKVIGLSDSMKRIVVDVLHLWNKVDQPDSARLRIQAQMQQFQQELIASEVNAVTDARFRYRKAAVLLGGYRLVFALVVAWSVVLLFSH